MEQLNNRFVSRCGWTGNSEVMLRYHDYEWGKPEKKNDTRLFEFLVLETAQAGLSWLIVLKKREDYRKAYRGFLPQNVAKFNKTEKENLLKNPSIIRNEKKINSSIQNAKAFLKVQEKFGSFSDYLWHFTSGLSISKGWKEDSQVPDESFLSKIIFQDMRQRNFTFIGPKIIHSYLQAIGVINDHIKDCFRFEELV